MTGLSEMEHLASLVAKWCEQRQQYENRVRDKGCFTGPLAEHPNILAIESLLADALPHAEALARFGVNRQAGSFNRLVLSLESSWEALRKGMAISILAAGCDDHQCRAAMEGEWLRQRGVYCRVALLACTEIINVVRDKISFRDWVSDASACSKESHRAE